MKILLFGLAITFSLSQIVARRCCKSDALDSAQIQSSTNIAGSSMIILLEVKIETFINDLKSFGQGEMFDIDSFMEQESTISEKLSEIKIEVETIKPARLVLSQTFDYAEELFLKTKDYAVLFEFFCYNYSIGQFYVCQLIHLNLKLLVFYNSQGVPNYQMDNYSKKIDDLIIYLNNCVSLFEDLVAVSEALCLAFNDQFLQANQSLLVLSKFSKKNR